MVVQGLSADRLDDVVEKILDDVLEEYLPARSTGSQTCARLMERKFRGWWRYRDSEEKMRTTWSRCGRISFPR